MKNMILFTSLITAFTFISCNKTQIGDEKLIIGKWELLTPAGDQHKVYVFEENLMKPSFTNQEVWVYFLSHQNNKLVITFKGKLNEKNNVIEEIARTPITIVNLNASEMEWEYEIGGFGNSSIVHEYLKKIE